MLSKRTNETGCEDERGQIILAGEPEPTKRGLILNCVRRELEEQGDSQQVEEGRVVGRAVAKGRESNSLRGKRMGCNLY